MVDHYLHGYKKHNEKIPKSLNNLNNQGLQIKKNEGTSV